MRLLRLLSLLVVAGGAHAQTAADSALVRDVVAALDVERQMTFASAALAVVAAEMPSVSVEPLRPSAATRRKVEAAAAAALLADLRPELLREALAFLRSGVTDRAVALASRFTTPGAAREIAEAMNAPDAALADEATARRFRRVRISTQDEQRTQERIMQHLRKSAALLARLRERGIPAENFFATMQAGMQTADEPTDAELFTVRYMLAQMPPADLEAMLAYGESDAARYLQQTVSEPVTGALAQWMGAWMESFLLALLDAPPPPLVEFDPADDAPPPIALPVDAPSAGDVSFEPTPVRDPLPDADATTGTYDLVDEEPQMIGGLDGFAARLVYPEAARRANVEGTVYVTFVVDHDGRPRHLSAVGAADEGLREAALDAVQASRFTPGRHDGQTVLVRFTLPVRFALR